MPNTYLSGQRQNPSRPVGNGDHTQTRRDPPSHRRPQKHPLSRSRTDRQPSQGTEHLLLGGHSPYKRTDTHAQTDTDPVNQQGKTPCPQPLPQPRRRRRHSGRRSRRSDRGFRNPRRRCKRTARRWPGRNHNPIHHRPHGCQYGRHRVLQGDRKSNRAACGCCGVGVCRQHRQHEHHGGSANQQIHPRQASLVSIHPHHSFLLHNQ